MKKLFTLVCLLGLLSLPALAQPTVEVFGGYQYLHTGNISIDGESTNSSQNFNGWDAAATVNLGHHFGITGDFSGNYATIGGVSTHVYTFAGGPVVFTHIGGIKPFAHALFGGVHLSGSESGVSASQNGFTTMVGGGLDAKVNRVIAVRLAQVDWLYYHFGSQVIAGVEVPSFSQSNNVRISSGIVIKF